MPTKHSMVFSLRVGLNNYLPKMVKEIFEKSLWINHSHIPTYYEAHPYMKTCIFSNINHKFTLNTKMNRLENNNMKPKWIYENDKMKGLIGWWNVRNSEGKGGWKSDISES